MDCLNLGPYDETKIKEVKTQEQQAPNIKKENQNQVKDQKEEVNKYP